MVNWRSPGRAERVVIYEESGELCQYWRGEDDTGNVLWRREPPVAGQKASGETMTTAELLEAVQSSLQERRRAGRGRKFRL
jgi:hypothetical protein